MSVRTLNELYRHAISAHPRPDKFRTKRDGQWVDLSTADFDRALRELSNGLHALGVGPGDRVALLSENRVEWALADFATLGVGAVVVPIYPTLIPEQIEYILNDCEPKAIFCSSAEQVAKLDGLAGRVPSLKHVIAFEPADRADAMTLAKVRELGAVHERNHGEEVEHIAAAAGPDDLATIIYTSGTTGDPKGVMLTHANLVGNVLGALSVVDMFPTDSCLSFLPLSHIFERMAGHYLMFYAGVSIAYAESVETVAMDMGEVRPTVMVSVPRLYEKIYARVLNTASQGSPLKRGIFFWAKRAGAQYTARKVAGRGLGPWLALKTKIADALVFKKLRARTGGRLRFFVSGGAPLAKEIAEFFYSAGLIVLEGYGLTETSPVIAVNTFEHFRPGSVGPPLPGCEVKIAPDGEILTRSPFVMRGYYNKEDATRETIVDGWLHTGDIGHLDEDGFLFITDRKKDLLVTAGGKNIAPQPIENELKLTKYVTEAVLIGDQRKYVTALLVPNFENLEEYARRREIAYTDMKGLLKSPVIESLFQHYVDKINQRHPGFEQIQYFRLLDHEFTQDSGELTPSLKVKRRVITKRYHDLIEDMYRE